MSERPEVALASIATLTEALERCWRVSGMPAKQVAGLMGVEYGHFVRMFRSHDSRHFPPDLIAPLMVECKSLLPLEWLAWRMGYCLHEKSTAAILVALRDVLQADGRTPNFLIHDNGRIERVRG